MSASVLYVETVLLRESADREGAPGIADEIYAYWFRDTNTITTLSTTGATGYDTIRGLLYVPEVDNIHGPCDNETLSVIPSNVTRRGDFPDTALPLIALGLWSNNPCTQSFLASMRADNVDAAIFFHNDNSNDRPPDANTPVWWSLSDEDRWKDENRYPVFAVSGAVGITLLQSLTRYNEDSYSPSEGGQSPPTPNDPDNYYIRLYARIGLTSPTGLPSLWIFLIIVLAVLLAIVLITSIIMHVIQRRQRTVLSRRVARGEVDLEALGIKRLNVPQDILDKMPQYMFTSKSERVAPTAGTNAPPEVSFSQPTCPICLDDFVHADTTIRELPCKHIFHPECIDPFLRDNSSLCPMCKVSALPVGYCPVKVTNLMVRRERLLRRRRQMNGGEAPISRIPVVGAIQRRFRELSVAGSTTDGMHIHSSRVHGHGAYNRNAELINVIQTDGRTAVPAPPEPVHVNGAPTQTTQVQPQDQAVGAEEVPAEIAAQGVSARRAWLRERVARRQREQYAQQELEARQVDVGRPLWRRILGRFSHRLE